MGASAGHSLTNQDIRVGLTGSGVADFRRMWLLELVTGFLPRIGILQAQ
jgi:hypothetical protein